MPLGLDNGGYGGGGGGINQPRPVNPFPAPGGGRMPTPGNGATRGPGMSSPGQQIFQSYLAKQRNINGLPERENGMAMRPPIMGGYQRPKADFMFGLPERENGMAMRSAPPPLDTNRLLSMMRFLRK